MSQFIEMADPAAGSRSLVFPERAHKEGQASNASRRCPITEHRRGSRSYLGFRIFLIALGLTGCSSDNATRVSTVEDGPAWRLGAPSVRVGGPGHELDRVYAGLLRSDGSLVIGNSGTSELRFYDARGRAVSASGEAGAGPGEFGSISWLAELPGDSLIVFDVRHQRFSVLSAEGSFRRAFMAQTMPPGPIRPIAVMDDGYILIACEGQYDPRGGAGVVRDSMRLMRMSATGSVGSTFGSVAGTEWLIYEHPAAYRATQVPWGRSAHLAPSGDKLFYASSETGTVTVYDARGQRTGAFDLDLPPRRLSERDVSAYLDETRDVAERTALARYYLENPELTAPAVTALRGDGAGNVWVRLFPSAGADSVSWMVFTPRGERLGRVRMATGWVPLDIRGDGLLLRESDADGVQHAAVRKVVR